MKLTHLLFIAKVTVMPGKFQAGHRKTVSFLLRIYNNHAK